MFVNRRFFLRYLALVFFACSLTLFLLLLIPRPPALFLSTPLPATIAPLPLAPADAVPCHILILIMSSPANTQNRSILRQSSYLAYPWRYNGTTVNFQYMFILGKSGDLVVDYLALKEAEVHGDIVIGDFRDSYSTLTRKVIWSFTYALKSFDFVYCMKVDEDSFVNLSFLMGYLNTVNPRDREDFYGGKPRQGDFTIGTAPGNSVIEYNLGGGYILSHSAMSQIIATHRSRSVNALPWEDVYVGVLASVTGIRPTRIYHYYVSKFYPFCTDSQSKLLHHTVPDLQARMMTYYDQFAMYCPSDMEEGEVMEVLNSYDITDWREH